MPEYEDEDEDYFLPLEDQRVFGAGIKRKRVAFVSPSTIPPTNTIPPASQNAGAIGDRYLSIVLPEHLRPNTGKLDIPQPQADPAFDLGDVLCAICRLPISESTGKRTKSQSHEASIAHQVCLSHSQPPSHLDRDRVGLKYLSAYGWDPDSRKGLGAKADGIHVPIKAKVKNDTVGLGVPPTRTKVETKAPARLNVKQLRRQETENKKKDAKLRELFYAEDLEPYLGPGD